MSKNYDLESFNNFKKSKVYKEIFDYIEAHLKTSRGKLEDYEIEKLRVYDYYRGKIFVFRGILDIFNDIEKFLYGEQGNKDDNPIRFK